MIRKLLVANRGEIAVRIFRAAQEMGIRTVAVYSEADRDALHVRLADEAIPIGPAEPGQSYLRIEAILEAARASGADAIHPGYGFLSERAEFSEACAEAGIRFVGPSGQAMRRLGAKIDAKRLAVECGVPITPGFFEPGASPETLLTAAKEIGFPVMLKASAGGGGRGMRIVRHEDDFLDEAAIASDEALKAFGDGAMMVEKLIDRPRHVEVQVLAAHETAVALFERECSIQRRHQKLIEEAPAPAFARLPHLAEPMRAAAVRLAEAAGYESAGTVEFMLDEATGDFYFLEVNARLQVEHPVTEAVTGLDLVQAQLRIAGGEDLAFVSRVLPSTPVGCAVEARIVAEDPARGFLPSIGPILAWIEPRRPGVRVDSGYEPGDEVSRYYDSLLAKVIATGPDRKTALDRLEAAMEDFHILGVSTNVPYLLDVLRHPLFRSGDFDTGFLGREFEGWHPDAEVPPEVGAIAERAGSSGGRREAASVVTGAWSVDDAWRLARGLQEPATRA
ncbi:MAG TPA: biotin carboxylase N-terminal domain-containing protein [Fimbriimonadaceae bacterium]|nr:biotin carboxylase N-terminal domain-containing protein [Fimbriimonadaceae bacterium]HRJ95103.1 biotin carboxylase N-terminal domain-containing protein [Fimbriimonadaceae bacterium]